MSDLRQIHEYLRPAVARHAQRGDNRRLADDLMRQHEADDYASIFGDAPRIGAQPRWRTWCHRHERAIGDWAVILVCIVAPLVLWVLGLV